MNTSRIKKDSRRGAAAVEFALTLPVLLLLLFGGYELTRANMILHTCEAAAYEGCRIGIVPGATLAEVEAETNRVLGTINIRNATVTVDPNNLETDTDSLDVTVEVSFADNSLFVPRFMGTEPFIRTCRLARESAD